jgi:hypothetical protein
MNGGQAGEKARRRARGPRGGRRSAFPLTSLLAFSLPGLLSAAALTAQAPATYLEHATTRVRAGADTTVREVVRHATYRVTLRGDTTVVQLQELDLRSRAGEEVVRHDTDGMVGGYWKLVPDSAGRRVVEEPFVPPVLADVADLARIMDDFFPPAPPLDLAVGLERERDGRRWLRQPGDGVEARFAWHLEATDRRTRTVADSFDVAVTEQREERGEGAWVTNGPQAWQRRIAMVTEARIAERLVTATAVTEIDVRRVD